ncbi:MAG TPA: phage virion morphogenesis protein [Gammaproteobacteria bacterium]|nr:phage virion morphogenesis protein [Gammaproteobacteria bacterium]
MSGATLVYDDGDVLARLNRLASFDASSMLTDIGETLVSSTTQRFVDGKGPDGSPWEPLAESTRLARVGGGKKSRKKDGSFRAGALRVLDNMKVLVDRGHLRDSITYQVGTDEVAVGSNKAYAAIHQFGGQAGRGQAVTIPARPFLGISADDEREINLIAQHHIANAIAGQ